MDRWGLGWDKENEVQRDRHQAGLKKRYKKIEVDIRRINCNKEKGIERYSFEFGSAKR